MKFTSMIAAASLAAGALVAGQAQAICMSSQGPNSSSTVYQNDDGSYHYDMFASGGHLGCGTLPPSDTPGHMSDFYLPYFDDMGIKNLSVAPPGFYSNNNWDFRIEANNDMFKLGGGVLHFFETSAPATSDYNSIVITFDAGFGSVKGPFYASVSDLTTGATRNYLGDPGIPGSPKTIKALEAPQNDVPEPASLALLAIGAAALIKRRRKA